MSTTILWEQVNHWSKGLTHQLTCLYSLEMESNKKYVVSKNTKGLRVYGAGSVRMYGIPELY